MSASTDHIWSFDIGTGSFGIALRKGLQFPYVDSLLIPDRFASIDAALTDRRQEKQDGKWRTLPGDYRLERELPSRAASPS